MDDNGGFWLGVALFAAVVLIGFGAYAGARFVFGAPANDRLRYAMTRLVIGVEETLLPGTGSRGQQYAVPAPHGAPLAVQETPTTSSPGASSFSPFAPGTAGADLLNAVAPEAPLSVPLPLEQQAAEEPVKIVIADAGISSSVSNPSSTDLSMLNEKLLHGAVRYPTTALLGEDGTVLIFGHSSYLPNVRNLAYKTFDGVQNLRAGAVIDVLSATTDYRYAVRDIRIMDAADASANRIPLPSDGKYLVIVTCDSFASATSRFVVEADFLGEHAL